MILLFRLGMASHLLHSLRHNLIAKQVRTAHSRSSSQLLVSLLVSCVIIASRLSCLYFSTVLLPLPRKHCDHA